MGWALGAGRVIVIGLRRDCGLFSCLLTFANHKSSWIVFARRLPTFSLVGAVLYCRVKFLGFDLTLSLAGAGFVSAGGREAADLSDRLSCTRPVRPARTHEKLLARVSVPAAGQAGSAAPLIRQL